MGILKCLFSPPRKTTTAVRRYLFNLRQHLIRDFVAKHHRIAVNKFVASGHKEVRFLKTADTKHRPPAFDHDTKVYPKGITRRNPHRRYTQTPYNPSDPIPSFPDVPNYHYITSRSFRNRYLARGKRTSSSVFARMPYGKYKRRRKYRRKKRGSHTAYHLASQAMTKVRRLERKVEVKNFDIVVNSIATVPLTGVIQNIALIAQGDTSILRDGNFIAPFRLDLMVRWHGRVAADDEVCRTIIFRDMRQVADTVPAMLDVIVSDTPLALYNVLNRSRFKILFDETWTHANDAAIRTSFLTNTSIKLYAKMGWNGAATTDIHLNGLFMINVAIGTPTVTFATRLYFNDS